MNKFKSETMKPRTPLTLQNGEIIEDLIEEDNETEIDNLNDMIDYEEPSKEPLSHE